MSLEAVPPRVLDEVARRLDQPVDGGNPAVAEMVGEIMAAVRAGMDPAEAPGISPPPRPGVPGPPPVHPDHPTVVARIRAAARRTPDDPAAHAEDGTLTYRHFRALAEATAARLRAVGARRDRLI